MNTFDLKIIASDKVFFDGKCKVLVIPASDGGEHAILAHHENMVMAIEEGEMRVTDENDNVTHAFVGSGFIEFVDNSGILLCVSAELPEEIDARRAQEAKWRAEDELRQKQSIREYHHSQANLARAMERLRVKNKYYRV